MHPTLVFDIETIPDAEHHKGTEFPKALFNQIVAVSYLKAELIDGTGGRYYSTKGSRSIGKPESSEKELVGYLIGLVEHLKPRLVTFNGRGFDLPVLKYRALKYGISAPWLMQGDGKWDNYGYRYSTDWHCDLMDALSDFGAAVRRGVPGRAARGVEQRAAAALLPTHGGGAATVAGDGGAMAAIEWDGGEISANG